MTVHQTRALLPQLEAKLDEFERQLAGLSEERKALLRPLVSELAQRDRERRELRLQFVCTHNSRRSQMAQAWAAAVAWRSGAERATMYSGGTEVTAFNPSAVAALRRAGFGVELRAGEDGEQAQSNPRYSLSVGVGGPELQCFSKLVEDQANPQRDFIAVMTCSEADERCPAIPFATRISLPYEDPKIADGTPEESRVYDERSNQIGMEMLWVFREAGRA